MSRHRNRLTASRANLPAPRRPETQAPRPADSTALPAGSPSAAARGAPTGAAVASTAAEHGSRAAAATPPVGGVAYGLSVDRLLADRAAARTAGRDPLPAAEEPIRLISTTVPVAGMTCRSCEHRIERHVAKIEGVERVSASAVHGKVEIESRQRIPAAAIERAIGAAGYTIGRTPWLSGDRDTWLTAIAGIVLVGVLIVLASITGLADLANGIGDLSSGGIAIALVLGLAAGVSTCAALVGGLVLALSAAFEQRRGAEGSAVAPVVARLRPALVFVAGRIAGYAIFGAALGALGASVTMPPQLTALLMIVVAVVMTILGTRLTGLSPRIATWSPTLPMALGRGLGLADGSPNAYSDGRAALLGAASFFLPCGFTQAVQVYALSTGSPLLAGAILGAFALGTAPGLLALAGLPVVVPVGWRPPTHAPRRGGRHRVRRHQRHRRAPPVGHWAAVWRVGRRRCGASAVGSRRRRSPGPRHDPERRRLRPVQRVDLRGRPDDLDHHLDEHGVLRVLDRRASPRHPGPAPQGRQQDRPARARRRHAPVLLLDGYVRGRHHDRRTARRDTDPGRRRRRRRLNPTPQAVRCRPCQDTPRGYPENPA